MRLPCPVGHNGLLSISGVSAGPPSLLTPPLCTDVHPATSLPHCYRDRTPRALRDLRAPSGGQVCLLGFLRHASELERQPNLSAGMLYRESR